MTTNGPPLLCELDGLKCLRCGTIYSHAKVQWICRVGGSKPTPAKPVVLSEELAHEREQEHCAGCQFYQLDRGTTEPICSLLECACGGKKATPEKKALLLAKKWRKHLANVDASCLLPKNKNWGPRRSAVELTAENSVDLAVDAKSDTPTT